MGIITTELVLKCIKKHLQEYPDGVPWAIITKEFELAGVCKELTGSYLMNLEDDKLIEAVNSTRIILRRRS